MTSLMIGEWNGAERSAEQLLAIGEQVEAASAILGVFSSGWTTS